MWNSNYIIKFELGEGIIKAANSPDNRNMFIKLFGSEPEDDAKLIMDGIKHIRKSLAKKNIILPSVQITDNTNIKYDEFICYWGIEKVHYSIDCLNDLFDFINKKAIEYSEYNNATFTFALETIERDQFQTAYDAYKKLYYISRQNDDFHSASRALTEVSGIVAICGQKNFAIQLASVAVQYAQSCNIVDQTLKCQVYLNLGNIQKCYDAAKALRYFEECSKIAYKSNQSQFLFFSLLGTAESYLILGDIESSLNYYEKSLALVNDNEMASSIQIRMIKLYKMMVEQLKNDNKLESDTKSKYWDMVQCIIKDVCKNLCVNAVFKLLKLQGNSALVSFGAKYVIENNIFKSSAVIGDNNQFYK